MQGISTGYWFFMYTDATIHLSNLTATYDGLNSFIESQGDLLLDISGTNTITHKNLAYAIYGNGTLKLSGNGTLTVTANGDSYCGIYTESDYTSTNNSHETTTEVDVTSQLAAPGYKVTRSARTDNGDGTYTWTYTVALDPTLSQLSTATASDYGKVVCAGGRLHPAKAAVTTGCTAVGILGKVTTTGHGLILALQDATKQTWNTINGWTSEESYANTTLKVLPDDAARGSLTSYTTLGSTAVSNWAVAQKSDYEAIFTNLGSVTETIYGKILDDNVNAYITTGVNGTELSSINWSATNGDNGTDAWIFSESDWGYIEIVNETKVRPVLGF